MQPLKISDRSDDPHVPAAPSTAALRLADADSVGGAPAVLALQQGLEAGWSATPGSKDRPWSPRRTMLLAVGVSLATWGGLAWALFLHK